VENLRTFAEINKTVIENIMPKGSRIMVKIIGVWASDIKFHSSKIVL
jgi:hypothetical protein